MQAGTHLESILSRGEFALTAELAPPRSLDFAAFDRKAEALRGSVDAVNLTDNLSARVRVSSLAASLRVRGHGHEPVLQLTCRDRNRLALQSDLLGAASLGIGNVLCLTGDHQSLGDHPQAKGVFDLDSINFLAMARRMCEKGVLESGVEIRNSSKSPLTPPRLFIGAAANPFAEPLRFRALRLAKKVSAGARFIQTQPVLDVAVFRAWMREVRNLGLHEKVHLLPSVIPMRRAEGFEFLARNVAGVSVPAALVQRMRRARDQEAEGITLCLEIIEQLRQEPGVHGIHIITVNWEMIIPEVVKQAGLLPRPSRSPEAD
ncbi:MAG: methylenetetrahydrofolate reductase [Candidatus Tectomicrobia bacterium]|nr:methylenetetrahydrofolate reductase [Candidatus Tectomicrobia bacterium]